MPDEEMPQQPAAPVEAEVPDTSEVGPASAGAAEPPPKPRVTPPDPNNPAPFKFPKPKKPPTLPLNQAQVTKLRSQWRKIRDIFEKRLDREGKKPQARGRYIAGARNFVEWCQITALFPRDVTLTTKKLYDEYIDRLDLAKIAKNVDRLAGHGMIEEAIRMNEIPDEEDVAGEVDGEEEVEADDEAPEPKRRRAAQPTVQPIQFVMPQPKAPRKPPFERGPARTGAARILPSSEKVRVYKRAPGGKKIYIQEYTVDDIGGSLHKFLKEHVDPEVGDPSGVTTYEVVALDANEREKGSGVPITIESGARAPTDDTISQARDAVALVQELRSMEEERLSKSQSLIEEAQKKAVGNNDLTSLMMLMMMQNMHGGATRGSDGDIALKIVEKLRGHSGGDITTVLPPALPPPMTMMPPPPPPESTLAPVVNQLLAAQLTPKPERSFADQMKELLVLKEMFEPKQSANTEMVALLKELLTRQATPPSGGIDGALQTFDKLTNVVKTLAPQVNMGGITGALQNILTPTLGQAIGNMLAVGIGKAVPGAPAQSPTTVTPPTTPPQLPIPARIQDQIAKLRAAKVEAEQVQHTLVLLQMMYEEAQYKPKLEPALQGLLTGNVKLAQGMLHELLLETRSDLASLAFINKVISGLIISAGGTPPPELNEPKADVKPAVEAKPTVEEVKPEVKPPAKEAATNGSTAAPKPAIVEAKTEEVVLPVFTTA